MSKVVQLLRVCVGDGNTPAALIFEQCGLGDLHAHLLAHAAGTFRPVTCCLCFSSISCALLHDTCWLSSLPQTRRGVPLRLVHRVTTVVTAGGPAVDGSQHRSRNAASCQASYYPRVCQRLNFVHPNSDLAARNIFLTSQLVPKITNFGQKVRLALLQLLIHSHCCTTTTQPIALLRCLSDGLLLSASMTFR